MDLIPITIPNFEEYNNVVSTTINIPNSLNYFIMYIYALKGNSLAYKIEYYEEDKDVITITETKLVASHSLIPKSLKKVIPYNIYCTTNTKDDPMNKYIFLSDASFYLYKND